MSLGRPRLRYRVGRTSTLLILLKRLLPEPAFERLCSHVFRAKPGGAGRLVLGT